MTRKKKNQAYDGAKQKQGPEERLSTKCKIEAPYRNTKLALRSNSRCSFCQLGYCSSA
jgi:hypothetical protein